MTQRNLLELDRLAAPLKGSQPESPATRKIEGFLPRHIGGTSYVNTNRDNLTGLGANISLLNVTEADPVIGVTTEGAGFRARQADGRNILSANEGTLAGASSDGLAYRLTNDSENFTLTLGLLDPFLNGVQALDGADTIFGSTADDVINGNRGSDSLFGGDGEDLLYGGQDSDIISGDLESDILFGSQGADTLSGGQGSDYRENASKFWKAFPVSVLKFAKYKCLES